MRVKYRHVYTVVVEGTDIFDDSATVARVQECGDRDARLNTIMVKHGGLVPVPVHSSVVTTTHIEIARDAG